MFYLELLCRFLYFSRLDTVRANDNPLRARSDFCPYALKIRFPPAACAVVCMTDIVAADRLLPAYCTDFCQCASCFVVKNIKCINIVKNFKSGKEKMGAWQRTKRTRRT